MEAPSLIRLGILLSVLSFCGAWYVQLHYFDISVEAVAHSGSNGFKIGTRAEFSVMETGDAQEEAPKGAHYQGPVDPPSNY